MTKAKTIKQKNQNGQAHEAIEETAVEDTAVSSDGDVTLARNLFLKPDNTADSPFEEYPGIIIMPTVMTIEGHRKFSEFVADADKSMKEISVFAVSGQRSFIMSSEMHYRVVFEFGKVEIDPGDLGIEIDKDSYNKLPAMLAAFIGCVGLEWQRRHAQFPGFRSSDMALSPE